MWQLLLAGFSAGDVDMVGNTPLHCAAQGGDVATARALLQNGAALDQRNELGNRPVDVAAAPGVHALLEKGAAQEACANCGVGARRQPLSVPLSNRLLTLLAPAAFSDEMLPYLCEASGAFFCVDCSVAEVVVADAEREEMRPVRYSRHALESIRQAEEAVTSALEGVAVEAERQRASRVDLTPLNAAVEEATAVGAAASAVNSAQMRQRQLAAARELEAAMDELDEQRCVLLAVSLRRCVAASLRHCDAALTMHCPALPGRCSAARRPTGCWRGWSTASASAYRTTCWPGLRRLCGRATPSPASLRPPWSARCRGGALAQLMMLATLAHSHPCPLAFDRA